MVHVFKSWNNKLCLWFRLMEIKIFEIRCYYECYPIEIKDKRNGRMAILTANCSTLSLVTWFSLDALRHSHTPNSYIPALRNQCHCGRHTTIRPPHHHTHHLTHHHTIWRSRSPPNRLDPSSRSRPARVRPHKWRGDADTARLSIIFLWHEWGRRLGQIGIVMELSLGVIVGDAHNVIFIFGVSIMFISYSIALWKKDNWVVMVLSMVLVVIIIFLSISLTSFFIIFRLANAEYLIYITLISGSGSRNLWYYYLTALTQS